jgi:hypothetical protein
MRFFHPIDLWDCQAYFRQEIVMQVQFYTLNQCAAQLPSSRDEVPLRCRYYVLASQPYPAAEAVGRASSSASSLSEQGNPGSRRRGRRREPPPSGGRRQSSGERVGEAGWWSPGAVVERERTEGLPERRRPSSSREATRLRPLAEAASKDCAPPAALLHGPAQLMGIFCFLFFCFIVSFFFSVLFFQCYVKRIFI